MDRGCAGCLLHSNKLLLSPEPHFLCAAKSCMFAGDSVPVFLPRPCWLISVISGGLVSTVTSNYHCSLDCQSYHQKRRGRCVFLYIGIKCLHMSCYSLNANPDAGPVQIAHSSPANAAFAGIKTCQILKRSKMVCGYTGNDRVRISAAGWLYQW